MTQDMKTILTRMFTVALLMMVSLGAKADVKVLFGEKGTELQPDKYGTITLAQKELTGGTITITQEDQKDGTFKVFISVTPDNGYAMAEDGPEVWAAIPTNINSTSTRAVTASTKLDLKSDDYKDIYQKRTYTTTIDSKLALWVKSADFRKNEDASKNTRGGLPTISTSSNPVYYLLQNSGTTSFYAMPYNNDENGKVTTTNVPNDDMFFYFMDAGVDGGIQYYYIIHRSGRYLYANGNANDHDGARLKTPESTSPSEDRYKFYIELCNNSAVGEGYYIINKTLGETAPLCKRSGNTPIANGTFLKLNTYKPRDAYFLWNFVKTPLTWTVPFTLSDGDKKHYYRINNTVNRDFYISRNASTDKVNTSSTASEDMYWYFEEVPAGDNGSDDYITYYYIIHALTGKYMCFDGNALNYSQNQDNAVSIQEKTASNEENCQFIIPRSSQKSVTTYFNIIPKALKNYVWNNQTIGQKNTTNGTIYTSTDRKDDTNASRWEFFEVFQAEKPVVQYDATQNAIIITSATEGATIYYTTAADEASLADPTPSTGTACNSGDLLQNGVSNKYIKAIAVKEGCFTSEVSDLFSPVKLQCAKPVIARAGDNVTISCSFPSSGVSIYFTKNGGEPTASSTFYSGSIPVTANDVIKAIAIAEDYEDSEVAERTIRDPLIPTDGVYYINSDAEFESFVDMANADGAGFHYVLKANISASTSITEPFTGIFDGGYHSISGLSRPLFNTITGGTVKNVVLDPNTTVNGNGAICNEADGSTKIYNCGVLSGTISGSGNVGGLVGHIASGSSVRVVNCYNFATVSEGTTMAGIVGKNEGTIGDVRIAMCMMYGNMQGGTSPVYAGNHVSNVRNYTEYNYWRSKADLSYTAYNDQLAIDKDEYLTRFPFYRHILNTHRELAAFFLFGESGKTVNDITANEVAEIGHWVLNKDLAPYPIVEEWKTNTKRTTVDIANNLPDTTEKGAGKLLNDIGDDGYYSGTGTNITKITAMGNNGYLTVNVSINGSDYSASLPITDMNEANYDYTWGKVVLPFANEFSGWTRDYSKVCTGWEITSITGGTAGTFANYNVSDRDCTAKDLYSNSDYIFAQGGNYIVPYGVTAINIKAHFANAFYLSDASYDVGYSANFDSPEPLGGNVSTSYHEQTVYTDLSTLVNALSTTTNPHDQAIVLVGNYHYNIKTLGGSILNTGKAVSIMSTDEDCNQEPDYGWYACNTTGRLEVPPLRFDFVPNIEMGMSSRVGSSLYPGIGIWHTRGWFELTETCVSNMSQCEINSDNFTSADNGKGNNRWIANSGCFVQIVRARDGNCTKLSYIQIGGNAYVKELYPGSHTDNARQSATVPIAVTGGQVDECYMTGYKAGATLTGGMIYFWCGGGKIKKFLGAYLENPSAAGITAKVDHALIGRFFGGGTSAAARIKGDINITINNSQVDFYCGGPEFGNMESGKGVTTHAIGTTFGEYYGAGFGGTSITYNREKQTDKLDITKNPTTTYDISFSTYYKRLESYSTYGFGSCYKFEYIFHSNGSNGVTRFYTGYAQFDLATTGNVTNVLNYCTIKKLPGTNSPTPKESTGEFYGAGCQGKVNGTVTSTLTNCTVERNAFGGGYKAESNEVEVYTTTQPSYSVYTKETGIFSDFGEFPTPETYTWVHGDNDAVGTGDDAGKLFTSKILTELGNVTGNIELTINGGYVGGTAQGATPEVPATTTTDAIPAGGCVYGGGNESKSLSNATVTLKGDAVIYGDVFGGGNKADVQGSATVNIQQ